ncbi:hypothetical protein ACMYSO_25555 (plasmid) [Klebsiella sp. B345]|uniref:hypothetical protein n=1 Tax=Klebsiella sp. B345 TaxID=2755398 RepID=UPI003DA9FFEC
MEARLAKDNSKQSSTRCKLDCETGKFAGTAVGSGAWSLRRFDLTCIRKFQFDEKSSGMLNGTDPVDLTETWYCQLDVALRAEGITGLNEEVRQAVITPDETLRGLPAPARLMQVLRDSPEAFPLTAASYDDTEAALADLLSRAGFTADQVQELQWHRIRWPLMSQEASDRAS